MKEPSKKELLDELRRARAENERLKRLVETQRPELYKLRRVVTIVRDLWNNIPRQLEYLNNEAAALMPTNDDLPTISEIRGILGHGANRVEAALLTEPNGTQAFDAVPASTDDK